MPSIGRDGGATSLQSYLHPYILKLSFCKNMGDMNFILYIYNINI